MATVEPYRKNDYNILTNMLNKLNTGQPTVKDFLIKLLNLNYSTILSQKVLEDEVTILILRLKSSIKLSNTITLITEAISV